MRVTSKGQVTIPRDLRDLAGIKPNSEVIFSMESGRLVLTPKDGVQQVADKKRLEQFLDTLSRLEGSGDQDMDANALMALTRDR